MNAKDKKRLLQQAQKKPRAFTEQEVKDYAEKIIMSYLAASLITLRDKFGFGKERMERFLEGESAHAQAINDRYVTTKEILDQIELETGFNLQEFIKRRYEELAKEG